MQKDLCKTANNDTIFSKIQEINLKWYENKSQYSINRNEEDFLTSIALLGIPESASAQSLLYAMTGNWVQENISLPDLIPRKDEDLVISNSMVYIFPNPAHDKLTISCDLFESDDLIITLYNLFGVEVVKENISGNIMNIDISNLPSGTYIVNISKPKGESKIIEKVVIQR